MHLNRISLIIFATALLAGCNLIGQGGSDLPTPTPNILPTIESVVDQRLAQFLALTPTPGPTPTLGLLLQRGLPLLLGPLQPLRL
jgi:hypothetical protein